MEEKKEIQKKQKVILVLGGCGLAGYAISELLIKETNVLLVFGRYSNSKR